MTLTPDEIERRASTLGDRAEQPDEIRALLVEVAAALRHAMDDAGHPVPAAPPALDDYGQLGREVATVLRAAREAAEAQLHRAATEAAAIRGEAERAAADRAQRAEAEAAEQQTRAKRVLTAAQEQSETIIAEAEEQARRVLTGAREQAEQHARAVASQTRRQVEAVLRAEREALHRLHEAHADVGAAIEALAAGDTRPVVDLTEHRPQVYLGAVPIDMADDDLADDDVADDDLAERDASDRDAAEAVGRSASRAVPGARGFGQRDEPHDGTRPTGHEPERRHDHHGRGTDAPVASGGEAPGSHDPVIRMVRHAVGRATHVAAERAAEPVTAPGDGPTSSTPASGTTTTV